MGVASLGDRAFSAGGDGRTLAKPTKITSVFFFLFFFSRGALSCPPNDSKPPFPFQLQDIQLVVPSCCRDVSSCCHLKVTARTSDCEG